MGGALYLEEQQEIQWLEITVWVVEAGVQVMCQESRVECEASYNWNLFGVQYLVLNEECSVWYQLSKYCRSSRCCSCHSYPGGVSIVTGQSFLMVI